MFRKWLEGPIGRAVAGAIGAAAVSGLVTVGVLKPEVARCVVEVERNGAAALSGLSLNNPPPPR